MTAKSKPHTFVEMESSLAPAKVGDYIYATVDGRVEPSRYRVTSVHGDTIGLLGSRGSERILTVAMAENTVWLCKGTRGRRVVRAWLESGRAKSATDPTNNDRREAELPRADPRFLAYVEALRAIGRAVGWSDTGISTDEDDAIRLADRTIALVRAKAELDRVHAEQSVRLTMVERDRDECRVALGQIRQVTLGIVPGSAPLPSNTKPHTVVIEVTAALLRATAGETRKPIVVDPDVAYRRAIGQALPERMQGDTP